MTVPGMNNILVKGSVFPLLSNRAFKEMKRKCPPMTSKIIAEAVVNTFVIL